MERHRHERDDRQLPVQDLVRNRAKAKPSEPLADLHARHDNAEQPPTVGSGNFPSGLSLGGEIFRDVRKSSNSLPKQRY